MKAQVVEVHSQRDAHIAQVGQGYTESQGQKGDLSRPSLLPASTAAGCAAPSTERYLT